MRENPLAQYRLRVGGRLRVYYDVQEAKQLVVIKAIGFKDRDKVVIGGEEIKL
jgi:mRNA-degrading endonuclease RelE of RelBE toxin-antitoxin system